MISQVNTTTIYIEDIAVASIEILNDVAEAIYNIYNATKPLLDFPYLQSLLGNKIDAVIDAYDKAELPIQTLKITAAATLVLNTVRFTKQIYKAIKSSDTWKKIDHLAKSITTFSKVLGSAETTLSTLLVLSKVSEFADMGMQGILTGFKTTLVSLKLLNDYLQAIAWVSALLSAVAVFYDVRKVVKADQFISEFEKSSGYNQDNINYDQNSLKSLKDYLEIPEGELGEKKIRRLGRYFQTDGEVLREKLLDQIAEIEKTQNYTKLGLLLDRLKSRLEESKNTFKLAVVADAVNLVGSVLILANVWNPLGFVLLGTVGLASFSMFAFKKVVNYRFESEMGLISRKDENISANDSQNFKLDHTIRTWDRIKDFSNWFFYSLFDAQYKRSDNSVQEIEIKTFNECKA